MKTGYKKFTANSENFNSLQFLRNIIKQSWDIVSVKWGGSWNGQHWENFSFFCTPETLIKIKSFCKENELSIKFSN